MGGRLNFPPYRGTTTLPAPAFNDAGISLGFENVHKGRPSVTNHAGFTTVKAMGMYVRTLMTWDYLTYT